METIKILNEILQDIDDELQFAKGQDRKHDRNSDMYYTGMIDGLIYAKSKVNRMIKVHGNKEYIIIKALKENTDKIIKELQKDVCEGTGRSNIWN